VKKLLHQWYWSFARRLYGSEAIRRIEFIDMRSGRLASHNQLRTTITEALELIAGAGQAFRELVESEIQRIVAVDASRKSRGSASPLTHTYVSPFIGLEAHHSRLLACHLVWVAEYHRQFFLARSMGLALDPASVAHACFDTQVAFVKTFPDAPDWLEYLQLQQPPLTES
jgi:hypothetical protein